MKKILTFLFMLFALPAFGQYQTRITSAPTNGTNEVQTITFASGAADGETFQLQWNGNRTSAIYWMDSNDALLDTNIQHGMDGIFGVGNTQIVSGTLSSGLGTILVDFKGAYATKPTGARITFLNDATGGSGDTVVLTTAGVLSSYRSAIPGAQLIETDIPTTWINTSLTTFSPVWAKLSATTGFITAVQSKDTANATTSLLGTKLLFAVGVSQTWAFRVVIIDSSSSSAGVEFGYAIPTSATIHSLGQGSTTGLTAMTYDIIQAGATAGTAVSTVASSTNYAGYSAAGTITTDGTHSGNVVFEFLKATSGTAIVKAGSYIIAWRIS